MSTVAILALTYYGLATLWSARFLVRDIRKSRLRQGPVAFVKWSDAWAAVTASFFCSFFFGGLLPPMAAVAWGWSRFAQGMNLDPDTFIRHIAGESRDEKRGRKVRELERCRKRGEELERELEREDEGMGTVGEWRM